MRDARELGGAWTTYQRHAFPAPAPDLAGHVAKYWVVSWDYAEPYRQKVVPYPNVHVTFREGAWHVTGVSSGHQVKVLSGRGGIFGIAFRPGCFRPFLGRSVSTITDRTIDAAEVFGPGLPESVDVPTVEEFLRSRLPEPNPRAAEAAAIVDLVIAKRELTRVDGLAATVGSSVRQLQRLFAEYVGIGPKWVIRRYRLAEVTDRLGAGIPIDWAALAADLGYADQAHFSRDFAEMFGESPTWYAARY